MLGIFRKFTDNLSSIFKYKELDEEAVEDLEALLYTADFGTEVVKQIITEIRTKIKKGATKEAFNASEIASEIIRKKLVGSEKSLQLPFAQKPKVIMLLGVNGAGKTTTAAKLAYKLKNSGASVILSACDTFRVAANEQIKSWAEKLKIELISSHHGADAAAVAYDSLLAAKKRNHDLLIIDTAGRLHTKINLMHELEKLDRVLKKQDPEIAIDNWLVIDGSIGSNSIEQAKAFNATIPIHGLIITKLDGTSRGGSIVAIYQSLKIPIYFIGIGEQPEDLHSFNINQYTSALFKDPTS